MQATPDSSNLPVSSRASSPWQPSKGAETAGQRALLDILSHNLGSDLHPRMHLTTQRWRPDPSNAKQSLDSILLVTHLLHGLPCTLTRTRPSPAQPTQPTIRLSHTPMHALLPRFSIAGQ